MILLRRRRKPIQMISLKLDTSTLEMMELTNRMKEEIIKASRIPSHFINGDRQGSITSGDGRMHVTARG